MTKIYHREENRLIEYHHVADSSFWENHWSNYSNVSGYTINNCDPFVTCISKKYLENGLVLEAGCGLSLPLYSLSQSGYDAVGIDYAYNALKSIKRKDLELSLHAGDIRNLPYKDKSFHGVWSLGVIEHFQNGCSPLLWEIKRVLKPGGFLFVSFPLISPLRKAKIILGCYPDHLLDKETVSFYQYIFDPAEIISTAVEMGFQFQECIPYDGIKGCKDEISLLKPVLQKLYDYSGTNSIFYTMKSIINRLLLSCSPHMGLIV